MGEGGERQISKWKGNVAADRPQKNTASKLARDRKVMSDRHPIEGLGPKGYPIWIPVSSPMRKLMH